MDGATWIRLGVLLLLTAVSACSAPQAWESPEEARAFFEGQTLTYVVATEPGGSYDTYGRLVARLLPKHLGVARAVVKNVPGGGHIRGANEIAEAPADGLTLGTFNTGMIQAQLLRREGVRFDLNHLSWIGKAGGEPRVLVASRQSGVRTIEDLRRLDRPLVMANSGFGNEGYHDSLLLADALGFDVRFVFGLPTRAAQLSMMRGEVEAHMASTSAYRAFVRDGHGHIVVTLGTATALDEAAPWASALDLDPSTKGVLAFQSSLARLTRWTAGPPGIPEARLAVLRQAYTATLADPEFAASAAKLDLPLLPMDGATLAEEVARALSPAPAIRERLERVLRREPPR